MCVLFKNEVGAVYCETFSLKKNNMNASKPSININIIGHPPIIHSGGGKCQNVN